MFKAARWRSDKNKIKAVFKLHFTASQIHGSALSVALIPVDTGKPVLRTDKAAADANAECRWPNPIYASARLTRDQKTGRIHDKLYQLLVSTSGSRVVGEATVNLAEYFEAFKPSSVSIPIQGAKLHVTVQRMQGDAEGRENDENGDASRRKTLRSQLSFPESEEHGRVTNGANNANINQEGAFVNSKTRVKFQSSRNMLLHADSGGSLTKSSSFDAISASGSECSSGQFTPRENGIKNNNTCKESASFLSPLSSGDTPRNIDWTVSSAPDGSNSDSTHTSGGTGSVLKKHESDLNALARQLEVSDIELQTLRKQVVKESRRGQDISRELSILKQERDALRKESEELKSSKKKISETDSVLAGLNDPWSMIEEMKEELDHEKNLNANLRLQLEKTQESNTELILAVRDLEKLLERKNMDTCEDTKEKESRDQMSNTSRGLQQRSFETSEHEDQYALDVLVKGGHDASGVYSQEQMITDLNGELELYKKDREDLEMQMEQLALDYEILKQENHDISSRLEQIQLREQLRMQYECSAHLAIINDLETNVESLETELHKQAEEFETNLAAITREKVEQEQRAIQAEELLRKTKRNSANIAEHLQEEVRRLSAQMSSAFNETEKIVLQKLTESRELHFQKSRLEELLEKTNDELKSVKHQHQVKCQNLISLIDFKTEEAERLYLELKNTREELENQRKSEVARQKASGKEMLILKAEMEQLSRAKDCLSEQIEQKERLLVDIDELKASICSFEHLLKEKNSERDALVEQLSVMKEEANKSMEEHSALRRLKDEQDEAMKILESEVAELREQYTDLKRSVLDDELEKENLRRQVFLLRGDLREEADIIASIEKKLKSNNAKLPASDCITKKIMKDKKRSVVATHGPQEVPTLNQNPEFLEDIRQGHGKEVESNVHNNLKQETKSLDSCECDVTNATELMSEMANLRERNAYMEEELKEMQEKYSEMSLKFAEVEGERQQLVITIRMLKNTLKN